MTFSFRIRGNRAAQTSVKIDSPEILLEPLLGGTGLVLKSADGDQKSLKDAQSWAFCGEGYRTEEEAHGAGAKAVDALLVAFAKLKIGVDLGVRASGGGVLTQYGQEYFSGKLGQRVINDTHGLVVFESEPPPKFVRLNMRAVLQKNAETFETALQESLASHRILTSAEKSALAIFASSFFEPKAEGRFLLLLVALEAVLEPLPKSGLAITLLDEFVSRVKSSSLLESEKNSLIGSLGHLKRESINRVGHRLASELLQNVYAGKPATTFFDTIYRLRSNLVHGNQPLPTPRQLANIVAETEKFVSDLIVAVIERRERSSL